jgi:hypothetical protein
MPNKSNNIVREYQADGSFIDRPMTAEEAAKEKADYDNWLIEQEAIEAKKVARLAVMEKLGLTVEDLQALGL